MEIQELPEVCCKLRMASGYHEIRTTFQTSKWCVQPKINMQWQETYNITRVFPKLWLNDPELKIIQQWAGSRQCYLLSFTNSD